MSQSITNECSFDYAANLSEAEWNRQGLGVLPGTPIFSREAMDNVVARTTSTRAEAIDKDTRWLSSIAKADVEAHARLAEFVLKEQEIQRSKLIVTAAAKFTAAEGLSASAAATPLIVGQARRQYGNKKRIRVGND